MKIAIVDYGLGNLFSIHNACLMSKHQPVITNNYQEIQDCDALILPGVGAFGDAMESLRINNLIPVLMDFAHSGKPFMGICLGMQLMFSESEEFGLHSGLGLIEGRIVKFPKQNSEGYPLVVPQTQWNSISPHQSWESSAFQDLKTGTYMHFVHSYFAQPQNPNDAFSITEYGGIYYASSVRKNNLLGIQFHPEKSGEAGLSIYKNWKNN